MQVDLLTCMSSALSHCLIYISTLLENFGLDEKNFQKNRMSNFEFNGYASALSMHAFCTLLILHTLFCDYQTYISQLQNKN